MVPAFGVIGRAHVQLSTNLSSCLPTVTSGEPNSFVCPVCLGLPGSLPSLNARAVQLGVKIALALGCSVSRISRFDRKHYFYPDLPKAFQVSQLGLPLAEKGAMPIFIGGLKKTVGVTRLHLEEDAGKLVHGTPDGRLSGASLTRVDYNRAGIPLAEIVSEPDMSTPMEAREYVLSRRLVRYLGASDGDMESGSLRVDVNVSQKCSDGRVGGRVEVKNVNSVRAMEKPSNMRFPARGKYCCQGGRSTGKHATGMTRKVRPGARGVRKRPRITATFPSRTSPPWSSMTVLSAPSKGTSRNSPGRKGSASRPNGV